MAHSHNSNTTNSSSKKVNNTLEPHESISDICGRIQALHRTLKQYGVHSANYMSAAGFQYTGDGDTAICKQCGLEISNWTTEMTPFTIHSQRQPNCSFVRSIKSPLSSTVTLKHSSTNDTEERRSKRQRVEDPNVNTVSNSFFEHELLQQVRQRTFSHWHRRGGPTSAQMIEAGFFYCNIEDRTICLHCNLICQRWIPYIDNPCEVHRTISPNCVYVKEKLMRPLTSSINVEHENSASTTDSNVLQSDNNGSHVAHHRNYSPFHKRDASFATWPEKYSTSVDTLVKAGFFYTGNQTIVTCFHCNGSLDASNMRKNPLVEHITQFPHCDYAKQCGGDNLYFAIVESNKLKQQRTEVCESNKRTNLNGRLNRSVADDEDTLAKKVADRLELPMSKSMLDKNFSLSIIQRCWIDQLRIKNDDFLSEYDLHIACLILQKQMELIDGNERNIVIPQVRMRQIQNEQVGMTQDTEIIDQSRSTNVSSNSVNPITTQTSPFLNSELPRTTNESHEERQTTDPTPTDPQLTNICVVCSTAEKQLACSPCGHFTVCIRCSESLQSCPQCRRSILGYVRIYL